MNKNKRKGKGAPKAPASKLSGYATEALKARVYDLSSVVQHASQEIQLINQELQKRAVSPQAPKVDKKAQELAKKTSGKSKGKK